MRLGNTSGPSRLVLDIALSRYATTILTSFLGFAFWVVAARMASDTVVGRSAAAISAMQLVATLCALGFPTLLIAELRQRDRRDIKGLVITSLALVGVVALVVGAIYGVAHRLVTNETWLYSGPADLALFGAGTAITAIVWVLDGALNGVGRNWTLVTRNLVFSLVKLISLPLAALSVGLSTRVVYSVWLLGNVASLIVVGWRIKSRREWLRRRPALSGLVPMWRSAASHHWVNIALQLPHLVMPIMVAMQLGAAANAAFYAALLIATFVWTAPMQLGVGLFALSSDSFERFRDGLDTAIRLSIGISVLAIAGAPLLARPVLGIFGTNYEQASDCLMILTMCTVASATKSIYIAVRRAQGLMAKAARAACLGSVLELGAVEVGIQLGGLTEVGTALGAAMVLQAFFFGPVIAKARGHSHYRAPTTRPNLDC